ncbi:MAG: transposase [Pseudomonadales bacterium]|nr:transposase [Pseudomonadales bacterium]
MAQEAVHAGGGAGVGGRDGTAPGLREARGGGPGQRQLPQWQKPQAGADHRGRGRAGVPRDRAGSFEPRLIGKHQRKTGDFAELIVALYAKGMSTRDIQAILAQKYGVEVSPTFISQVTDAVWTRSGPGRHGHWSRSIRLSTSMCW